jgi:biotin operon repressor
MPICGGIAFLHPQARSAGVSLSGIARELGVSRQRVQKIFERLDRG